MNILNILILFIISPQFVPFRQFLVNGAITNATSIQLAREVLAEIPEQIQSYMKMNRVKPNLPPPYQP